MDSAETQAPAAWQPITPQGVADFARASFGRLLLVQFVCAMVAAGAVTWFIAANWLPVIEQAIKSLPEEGSLSGGQLYWQGPDPVSLAENRFLAITADTLHEGSIRSPAHIQVEFGQRNCRIISLVGHSDVPYPTGYTMPFNRLELQPLWGAWRPALLIGICLVTIVTLVALWTLMACLYVLPAVLIAFYTNRQLSTAGAWRLAAAALMPGSLVMTGGVAGYGLGWLEIVQFAAIVVAHFVISWIYLAVSPLTLPRLPVPQRRGNPFRRSHSARQEPALVANASQSREQGQQADH